jgi:hypothetical protein
MNRGRHAPIQAGRLTARRGDRRTDDVGRHKPEGLTMTRAFAGTFKIGDLREALSRAIADAKSAVTIDPIE